MKIYATAIVAYRSFSSKSSGVYKGFAQRGGAKKKMNSATWTEEQNEAVECVREGHSVFITGSAGTGKSVVLKQTRKITWTEEQNQAVACVREGHSVFITGSAGTGKSVVLKHMINVLRRVHGRSTVFVTASTGIAACALKGQTIHSFSGFGLGNVGSEKLLDRIKTDRKACKRWNKAKALVIDEISMVDPDMFDKLEFIAREIRGSSKVWGGIQLIVSGDFFQLPPVKGKSELSGKEFAFEADCWDASFSKQIELTKIFRQSDARLIKMLQGIRKGSVDDEDLEILGRCCSFEELDSSVVRLYPRIKDVDEVNEARLESLNERPVNYGAVDGGVNNYYKSKLPGGIAPDQLVLCKGARVMLTKNLNTWSSLCNGATGMVIGFVSTEKDVLHLSPTKLLPVVKFDTGLEIEVEPEKWEIYEGDVPVAWRFQIPLVLAWALSIHKSQGMTLKRLHTDLSKSFGYGMEYVALSRVESLEGLSLSGFSPGKIKAHPKVRQFYERFGSENNADRKQMDDGTDKTAAGAGPPERTTVPTKTTTAFSLTKFLLSRIKQVR